MVKKSAQSRKASPRSHVIIVIIAVVVIGLAGALFWVSLTRNEAQAAAHPFETALLNAGGTQICTKGDSGYGPDNNMPWYESYIGMPLPKDKAIELVNSTANANGYHLTHAAADHRIPALPADAYLDAYYFDNTSQQSSYADLKSGVISLDVGINGNGSDTACPGHTLTIDTDHSVVTVHVVLPEVKR